MTDGLGAWRQLRQGARQRLDEGLDALASGVEDAKSVSPKRKAKGTCNALVCSTVSPSLKYSRAWQRDGE